MEEIMQQEMRELQPNSYASSNGSASMNSDAIVFTINQDPQQQEQNRVTAAAGQRQGGGGVVGMGVGLGKGTVKVMTDEQMQMLRKQICVYATISKRLADLQNALSHSGTRLTFPYGDPLSSSAVNKIPSRQRWTPTSMQLEILERMFKQCRTTPGRHKIKEITDELAQHGQISEANVYNWFQNRRARSKRKQPAAAAAAAAGVLPNTVESRGGGGETTTVAPAKEKTSELEVEIQPDENLASIIGNMQFQGPNIGIDQLIGKMEAPGSYR